MDNSLQQLLDAELEAEALIKQALEQREQMTSQALEEARLASDRFEAQIPQIRQSFMEKAEARVAQNISEIKLRYKERSAQLQQMAQAAQADALAGAVAIILDTKQP